MNNSNRNWVILYVKLEGCGACQTFQPQWDMIVKDLEPYATATILEVPHGPNGRNRIPACLLNYISWFPTVFLMTAEEYEKYFTYNGTASGKCDLNIPADLYKYSTQKPNFSDDLGLPMTAKAIENWFSRTVASHRS